MNRETDGTAELVIGLVIGFVIGGILFYNAAVLGFENRAIEHGAAQHNAQTGEFEWKKAK